MFNRMDTSELNPTSKLSLKLSCLKACGNDIDKATKLYAYIGDGLDIPDTDPIPATGIAKVMNGVDGIAEWIEGHGTQIEKVMTYIQLLRNKQ